MNDTNRMNQMMTVLGAAVMLASANTSSAWRTLAVQTIKDIRRAAADASDMTLATIAEDALCDSLPRTAHRINSQLTK